VSIYRETPFRAIGARQGWMGDILWSWWRLELERDRGTSCLGEVVLAPSGIRILRVDTIPWESSTTECPTSGRTLTARGSLIAGPYSPPLNRCISKFASTREDRPDKTVTRSSVFNSQLAARSSQLLPTRPRPPVHQGCGSGFDRTARLKWLLRKVLVPLRPPYQFHIRLPPLPFPPMQPAHPLMTLVPAWTKSLIMPSWRQTQLVWQRVSSLCRLMSSYAVKTPG
jgi:hypothetical protein